jgi:peptidoglycan/xylan/chitin deacetylase (PgdA/CDA1 family)
MKKAVKRLEYGGWMRNIFLTLLVAASVVSRGTVAWASQREVAITFDDLPFVRGPNDLSSVRQSTKRMLDVLRAHHVPAIGFVTENKIHVPGEMDERVRFLEMWLDAGMTLGNHTYSHLSLNDTPLERYEDDVIKGEVITRRLMEAKGLELKYFRYPYTRSGPTAETKQAFLDFLRARDYKIAPFTVENTDYVFNAIYVQALEDGDQELADRVRSAYLDFQDTIFGFFEELSMELFGYEIKQILLIHANKIHADCLEELLTKLEKRGYSFVSLDDALKDEAYQTPDEYVGPIGPSWLHRWSIHKGIPMREVNGRSFPGPLLEEPDPPQFILELFRSLN